MMRNTHRLLNHESRSYSEIDTYTDHRLVKTKLYVTWYKMKTSKTPTGIYIGKLLESSDSGRERMNNKKSK